MGGLSGVRYYFAYGSNLWVAQMDSRCPGNRKIGPGVLHGYRWMINTHGYATIVADPSEVVHGVVYTLNDKDEGNLDEYEEVASGLYEKHICLVQVGEQELLCLAYINPVISEGLPGAAYIARINHGLRDAGLPEVYVQSCIRRYVPADHVGKESFQ